MNNFESLKIGLKNVASKAREIAQDAEIMHGFVKEDSNENPEHLNALWTALHETQMLLKVAMPSLGDGA